jgi:predicted nuclease of predicted toxin-antitoxin system
VRFLIDAQLPPELARYLLSRGHQAEHVFELKLATASDRRIWNHALAQNAALITKDEDFVTMRALSRDNGPAIVWVRVGNTTTRALVAVFDSVLPGLIAAIERGETVIQIPER